MLLFGAAPSFVTMIFTGLVIVLFIAALIFENTLHQRRLKSFPVRILVNGTRGKTSVCRLLVAALNRKGIKTIGRTTGSEACVVFPDGHVEPFVRKRNARITEMVPFLRLAGDSGATCIVVECMALIPENQKTFSRTLIKPTHMIITNSYIDHVAEIGVTGEETRWTLARSLNPGCELYATEDGYGKFCEEAGCRFHLVAEKDYESMELDSKIPVHNQNLSLVCALAGDLGIDEKAVLEAASEALGDSGLRKNITGRNGCVLIPSFAINDEYCMKQAIIEASGKEAGGRKLCLVYNNRSDREYRLMLMRGILKEVGASVSTVYCIGDYPAKVSRYFSRADVKCVPTSEKELFGIFSRETEDTVLLGLGNIKGSGERFIELCLDGGL